MKLFTHRRLIKLAVAALTAALITLLTGLGVFRWMDNPVADMLFQRQELTSGRVVVIGIDEKALQ
jgi:CHASE2 domain-containing sensor protein